MAKRAIKTIGDVREALLVIIPPGLSLWCAFTTQDSRSRGGSHHYERYSASLFDEQHKEVIDVDGGTAADLYRNFTQALNEWRKPRRVAAAPVSDEHDNVRAGPRRIAATVVQRRLCAE